MKKHQKWDIRFLRIAREVSMWSKDPSSKIGAVIVNQNRQIISTGYNGFPRDIPDKQEYLNNREIKYKYVIHAEANAIYNALYNNMNVLNSTIYVFGLPVCSECLKMLCQCGIKRVVYCSTKNDAKWSASFETSKVIADFANIEIQSYDFQDLLTSDK